MSSIISTTSKTSKDSLVSSFVAWRARIAVALFMVVTCLATLLLWRMCRGVLQRPLPLVGLLGFAILLPCVAMVIRAWYPRRSEPNAITATQNLAGYFAYLQEYLLPSLLACVIAVALTIRGSHPLGITLIWVAVGLDTLGVLLWPRLRLILNNRRELVSTAIESKTESPATAENSFPNRLHEPDLPDEPATELEQGWLFTEPGGLLELRRWQTSPASST